MAHDVFISYAAEDKPTADAVCAALEARGIGCWVAPRDVLPGKNYAEEIIRAIRQSRVMVLILSAHSNHSAPVAREVERAADSEIDILTFRTEPVAPSPRLEFFISATHWLDALGPPLEAHLNRLLRTVELLLGPAEDRPRPSVPVVPKPRGEARVVREKVQKGREDKEARVVPPLGPLRRAAQPFAAMSYALARAGRAAMGATASVVGLARTCVRTGASALWGGGGRVRNFLTQVAAGGFREIRPALWYIVGGGAILAVGLGCYGIYQAATGGGGNPVPPAATASPTPTPTVTPPVGPGGKIAFISPAGDLLIGEMLTRGFPQTTDVQGAAHPAWSPGGERVAFVTAQGMSPERIPGEVRVLDLAKGRSDTVVRASLCDGSAGLYAVLHNPRWWPDASAIIYQEDCPDPAGARLMRRVLRWHVLFGPVTDSGDDPVVDLSEFDRLLGETVNVASFDIAAGDGAIVAEIQCRARNCIRLALLQPGGFASRARILKEPEGNESYGSPAWSPDESKIAYYYYDGTTGEWRLRVLNLDTGNETDLDIVAPSVQRPSGYWVTIAWSPDGRYVTYDGDSSIWVIEAVKDAKSERLGSGLYPAWGHEGGSVGPVTPPRLVPATPTATITPTLLPSITPAATSTPTPTPTPTPVQSAFAGLELGQAVMGGGVLVTGVVAGSPAKDAGVKAGDVITAVDGQPVSSGQAVADAIAKKRPGDKIILTVRRDHQEEDIVVTLGERSED
jgi:hypothetical protein